MSKTKIGWCKNMAEENEQQPDMSTAEVTEEKVIRPPREGSTRLPPFPLVRIIKPNVGRKPKIYYDQVPELRKEMKTRLFKLDKTKKFKNDFKRTSQDFWRMELDRLNKISDDNKRNMKAAIEVYLGQTEGSTHAIHGLMKHLHV